MTNIILNLIPHLLKDPTDCVLVVQSSTGQNHDQTMRRQFSPDPLLAQVGVTLQLMVPVHVDQHLGGGLAVIHHLQALPEFPRLRQQ